MCVIRLFAFYLFLLLSFHTLLCDIYCLVVAGNKTIYLFNMFPESSQLKMIASFKIAPLK